MSDNLKHYLEPALRFGGLGSLITIIGIYSYYALGAQAFANATYGLVIFGLLFLVNTGMAVGAGLSYKRVSGGVLRFKDAVAQTFVTLAIIAVCYHVFYSLLLNIIDPTLLEKLTAIQLEQLKEGKEAGDISDETYNQQKDLIQNSELSFLDTFWLTLLWIALSFLFSLVLAAIIRKEPEAS